MALNKKKLILFGTGYYGRRFLEELGSDKVFAFADSNEEIVGRYIEGKKVISLEEIQSDKENIVIFPSVAADKRDHILSLLHKHDLGICVVYSPYYEKINPEGQFYFGLNVRCGGNNFFGINSYIENTAIGFASYIGKNSRIEDAIIGKYTSIGPNLSIIRGRHPSREFVSTHPAFYSVSNSIGFTYVEKQKFEEFKYTPNHKALEIGNDVWIGSDVKIMEGVTIADGSVVAAGALVTKDIAPYSVVGGVPARLIRYRFDKEDISYLLKLQWWDKSKDWLKENMQYFDDIKKLKVGGEPQMNILIWGTGQIAKNVLSNGINGNIIGFIESRKSQDCYMNYNVYDASNLPVEFDYIIVANNFSDQIYDTCIKNNIDLNRVIFLKKGNNISCNISLEQIKDILGAENYTNYLGEYNFWEYSFFEDDKKKYSELNQRESFNINEDCLWPAISDKYAFAGNAGNYFWQDLWAARKIIGEGIKEHYDIGSRLDGFIGHLIAADIKVKMIDIRPFPVEIDNLYTIVDDATMMKNVEDSSLESISALCSLEHFGLGRYGDPIDPEACFKCFEQIKKKLRGGGNLYISVPIGKERVEFNAHRVFYASTIRECFGELELKEFSCVAAGNIEYHVDLHKYDEDNHNGEYRYGLFHFVK